MRLRVHSALRWVHTYLSLLSLLAVLFFSATGLTLNHPEWIGSGPRQTERTGTLPFEWVRNTTPRRLEIVEWLRSTQGVRGALDEFRVDEIECNLTFKAPGYAADIRIARPTGETSVFVTEEGTLAALNDLHKGRHSGRGWALLIDACAIGLCIVSLTGLGLLFYLKRIRRVGLLVVLTGIVAVAVLAWRALG